MRIFRYLLVVLCAVLVLVACHDESTSVKKGTINDLSSFARNYIQGNFSTAQDAMLSSQGSPVNASFQQLYNAAGNYAKNGRIAGDSASSPKDTTIIDNPGTWTTCGNVTYDYNPDGSYTYIADYGTGCYQGDGVYRYFLFGKTSYVWSNKITREGSVLHDIYNSTWSAENYGGRYYYNNDSSSWLSNGSSTYDGESMYDSANQIYSGHYSYDGNSTYTYDTVTYQYKGHGQSSYTQKSYRVESNVYEYTYGNDYYKTEVIEPLVMNYDCLANTYGPVGYCYYYYYVSGREFIRYKQGDVEGAFEINYGDGTCDNTITITENGKSVEIELNNIGPVID